MTARHLTDSRRTVGTSHWSEYDPRMSPARAERFVVVSLRLLAAGFAVAGLLFIAFPDGVLDATSDLGDALGDFSRAPATVEKLWLGLGFAYMVVIAGIALVVAADVARYRPLLGVLAAGKVSSSLAGLGFYLFDDDVFIYLLNFALDGCLVAVSLFLWRLAGRLGEPAAPA